MADRVGPKTPGGVPTPATPQQAPKVDKTDAAKAPKKGEATQGPAPGAPSAALAPSPASLVARPSAKGDGSRLSADQASRIDALRDKQVDNFHQRFESILRELVQELSSGDA